MRKVCLVLLSFKGHLIYIHRSAPKTMTTGEDRQVTDLETLTLWLWGTEISVLKELIQEALAHSYAVRLFAFKIRHLTTVTFRSKELV